MRGVRSAAVVLIAGAATVAAAQTRAPAETADPIRCWWRTGEGAVATGETFTATLTCAMRDDGTTRVTLDESRLGASVVQLSPFEVLGGAHPADLRTGTHRFVQYDYSLRVIDRDLIGRDATFPTLQLPYKVQTGVGGTDTVEGRDRTYLIPGRPVRVLSLVPAEADDIRDSSGESFATAATLRFRARALRLTALALGALGLLVLAPAALRLARGTRRTAAPADRVRPAHALAAASTVLAGVDAARRGGWTPELVAQAVAAVRISAACALGRRFAERPVMKAAAVPPEHIRLTRGWLRRTECAVSSPVTTPDFEVAIRSLPLTTPHARRVLLDDLRLALGGFTSASYGAGRELDAGRLDESLAAAMRATTALRRSHAWPRGRWSPARPAPASEVRA